MGSNPPQIGYILHFFAEFITKLNFRVKDLGMFYIDFRLFIFCDLNDTAKLEHLNFPKLLIIANFYVPPATELLSCCRGYRLFNSFHKKILVKPAIPANLIDDTF